jgi:hypothetical protein
MTTPSDLAVFIALADEQGIAALHAEPESEAQLRERLAECSDWPVMLVWALPSEAGAVIVASTSVSEPPRTEERLGQLIESGWAHHFCDEHAVPGDLTIFVDPRINPVTVH